MQSEVGLLSITGTEDAPAEGRHLGRRHRGRHVRVLRHPDGAVRARRTGRGAAVEVSLFDALAEWMGAPAYYTGYGGVARRRAPAPHHASIAPYGPFATADGASSLSRRFRTRASGRASATDVLGRPELADDRAVRDERRCAWRTARR